MTSSVLNHPSIRKGLTDDKWEAGSDSTTLSYNETLTGKPSVRKIEFKIPGGVIVADLEGDPPSWMQPVGNSLVNLLDLPAGWDSYGAKTIDLSRVLAALNLLMETMQEDTPAPSVVPMNCGGVQLEWHTAGIDLEIEVVSPHRFYVSFEDSRANKVWEKEIISDFRPLIECMGLLAGPT